ncbi:type I-E CRISPR-associated protein Cse1/CasA [Nocardiopsis sp. NPDC101807]|uniref:type I-E CRISPR-associated protein Cse1/CasA n=1 Tax=Nocardiopsis sp. NPDC101807 TaxID=3364339 RepID=UPI00382923BD
MSTPVDFNLMDDPWLPFITTGGSSGTGSIRYVLTHAHEIRDLTVDVPTQYPPVLRMLVAVLHRALADKSASPGTFPWSTGQWKTLHQQERLPEDKIALYADTWRNVFGLFDREEPFLQVPEGKLTTVEDKTVALLVSDASSGNNVPLFSAGRDDSPSPLTPAQAARWLLHVHAWDTAGIKTGAKEDPRAKAGKTTGNHTGPLGDLGVLMPAGNTLKETLLFNLLVLDGELTSARDLPAWERGPLSAAWVTRVPVGLLDRYTWVGRRIRLIPENDGGVVVRKAVVCAGDRFEPLAKPQTREPHTAWLKNRPKPEEETPGKPTSLYRPNRHTPGQELWRGLGGLLGWDRYLDHDDSLKPQVLHRLSKHFARGRNLPVIQLRAYGISYGLQNAVISDTYFDTLPLPVVLLLEGGTRDLGKRVVQWVADTEEAARALGHLAADLAFAEGGAPDTEQNARDRVTRQYFANLDHRFRAWISKATDPDLEEEYRAEWHGFARREARILAAELVSRTGPGALRTRTRTVTTKKGEPITVNLVIAQQSFNRRLRQHLGAGEV